MFLEQALAVDPRSAEAKLKLGGTLASRPRSTEDMEIVLRLAREVLDAHPRARDGHKLAAMANFYLEADGYLRHLEAVAALTPEGDTDHILARTSLLADRLQRGDFTAWSERVHWEDRMPPRAARLRVLGPLWDAAPLGGRTILLHTPYDGHGDAFQFIRYAPMVRAMGGRVRLACYPVQERLFAACGGRLGLECVLVVAPDGSAPERLDHHVHAPVKSLPALLGTTPTTIPADAPYLTAPDEVVEHWRPAVGRIPGFRVGVAWQGDPRHGQDFRRSFRLAELAPLAEVPGISLVALQKDPGLEQLADAGFPVVDLGPEYQAGDWLDTAAVITQLDLVVSPDTAICHLSGALGKPTWTALPRPAEWRWMLDRDDSPWYPTMRLFRQERLGEWGPVFRRMVDGLALLASGCADSDTPRSEE